MCETCDFSTKCVARNKLKPFFAEARTDLGVELTFNNCGNYISFNNYDKCDCNDSEDGWDADD